MPQVIEPVLADRHVFGTGADRAQPPRPVRMMMTVPWLRRVPAYFLASVNACPAILAQMVSVNSAPAGTAGMVAAARGRNSSAQYTTTAGPMLARVSRHLALC